MTEQTQPGQASYGHNGGGPASSDGRGPGGGDWSRRKALVVGAVIGAVLGLIFFAAYAGVSAAICAGMRECPAHWAPYLIVSSIGWVVSIGAGAAVGFVIHGLYKLFKVT